MSFVIEKGVPVPPGSGSRGPKYPFHEMQVGDSFFVAGKTLKAFGSTVSAHRKKHGGKFICRSVDGGVRVWRVE